MSNSSKQPTEELSAIPGSRERREQLRAITARWTNAAAKGTASQPPQPAPRKRIAPSTVRPSDTPSRGRNVLGDVSNDPYGRINPADDDVVVTGIRTFGQPRTGPSSFPIHQAPTQENDEPASKKKREEPDASFYHLAVPQLAPNSHAVPQESAEPPASVEPQASQDPDDSADSEESVDRNVCLSDVLDLFYGPPITESEYPVIPKSPNPDAVIPTTDNKSANANKSSSPFTSTPKRRRKRGKRNSRELKRGEAQRDEAESSMLKDDADESGDASENGSEEGDESSNKRQKLICGKFQFNNPTIMELTEAIQRLEEVKEKLLLEQTTYRFTEPTAIDTPVGLKAMDTLALLAEAAERLEGY